MAAFLIVGSVVASVFHDNVSIRPSPPPTIANFTSALFPFVFRVSGRGNESCHAAICGDSSPRSLLTAENLDLGAWSIRLCTRLLITRNSI